MGGVKLRLLKTQQGRCPLCGGLLLFADREPQSPAEWEQWITVIRKALRKEAIAVERGQGITDGPDALQLVHTDCQRRHVAVIGRRSSATSTCP